MNVYFAGSISGGRDYVETYREMIAYLRTLGHHVFTEHIIDPNVFERESRFTPEEIYKRDMEWLEQSDCLIADVSNPSLGVGFEVATALFRVRPCLCLYHKDVFLSRMILGNPSPVLWVRSYTDAADWQCAIQAFFRDVPKTG